MPKNKSANSDSSTAEVQVVTGREAFSQAAIELVASARREISLLSFDLDARLYNRDDVTEALKDFILISPRSRLKILLHDDAPPARGHRVVDLGRKLSSFVEFRVLGEKDRNIQADWLIIDGQQLLERRAPDSLEATRHSHNTPLGRARSRQFDTWWDAAQPASALRALHFQ